MWFIHWAKLNSELAFGIMGFSGGTQIGEGGVRIMGGKFEKFLCEGTELACTTKTIDAGIISTKEYGKIKVSAGTFGRSHGIPYAVSEGEASETEEATREEVEDIKARESNGT